VIDGHGVVDFNPKGESLSRGPAIEISWASRKLEKQCGTDREGRRQWGGNWPTLRKRLAALVAAPTLRDMEGLPGRCHELHANRAGQFAVALWGATRLVFEPDHDPTPRLDDGGIDCAAVTRIRIKEVIDYHGE
jgi:plasmid maintenance system killer protein